MPGGDAKTSPIVSLIAGGTAGGIESAITYPFEFAKTRVQLRSESVQRNPFIVVRDVVRNEGARALYTGLSTLVVGTVAKDAIRFMSFDAIKTFFEDPETHSLTPLRNLASGMCAGVVSSTLAVTPSERIKTAMIDDARSPGQRRFQGPIHTVRVLVQEHGLRALYRGYVSTTLKQAGTTAFRLGTYNILKDYEKKRDIPQNTATNFANGAIAGTVTTYATQPVDTIKTRAQSAKGAGIVEATRTIWLDYGIRGFWRGTTMRLGRTVMAGGILFTSYEWIAAMLNATMGKVES